MPPCQPAMPVPAAMAARRPASAAALDGAHRVALHDEVDTGHVPGVGIDVRRVLDADVEAVLTQVGDEHVGRLDG